MCGIAGIIGHVDAAPEQALQCMSHAMVHRGPDDHGFWKSAAQGRGAAFAFRRLAIIDLSPDAHQPMIDPKRGNVLVFNGEIYNFQEIRTSLEREGETFQSSGDTEVLLKAYGRWGVDALQRLRGMFALAIWDQHKRQALLARDRLGIKPLYICRTALPGQRQIVLFASEVRALLASGLIERTLDPTGLATYLWNGFVPGPSTIIKNVELLDPGTYMIIDDAGVAKAQQRYWTLPAASAKPGGHDQLQHELETAIEQHLISDVPLGVFLSGGIDSSAITAMAARRCGSQLRTFNISFDEAQYDESHHAAAVASALGTKHTTVRLTHDVFRANLEAALASIDQPTFDAVNTYFVSRAVREAGMTVALAGTGGDELLGGYRSFAEYPRAARAAQLASIVPERWLKRASEMATRLKVGSFGEVPPQSRWGKLGDVLATRGRAVDLYQTTYSMFTRDYLCQLMCNGTHHCTTNGLPPQKATELQRLVGNRLDLHNLSLLELTCYLGDRLLRDTDSVSMAVSLEVRVPLLDHRVVEAVASIDPQRRFHPLGKKQLLRDLALRGLDPALFDRPKAGFELPIGNWCRQDLRHDIEAAFAQPDWCESVGVNHDAVQRLWRSFQSNAPGIYWSRIWAIFVLLHWCRSQRVSL